MAGMPSAPADPGQITPPPAAPPPTTPPQGAPPATPPPAGLLDPDKDPNLAMSRLVSKSREKLDKVMSKGMEPPKEPETAPAEPPKDPPKAPVRLNDLIGKALKMRQPDPEKEPETPAEPPPAPAEPPKADAAPAEPAKKPAKTKRAAPEVDHGAIAREAATAATEAALRSMPKEAPKPTVDPLEGMTEEDKRDYEVAQHLAKIDPRFKDAPDIIVGNLKKAENYAAQWERSNPGKQFDPNDDEHDEFFSGIQTPWSQSQFQNAAIDLLADKKTEKLRAEQDERLRGVEASSARSELKPHVEQRFAQSTFTVAQAVGEDIAKTLETSGWSGLAEQDPVLAQVLGATMQQVHPFIEAAVHIDDPRIGLNKNDPMHHQWSMVVQQGEAQAAGQRDDRGRLFARRADYARMSQAERSKHWFLTTDDIIKGALDYAADQVQKITEAQKAQLEKLGFKREVKPKSGSSAAPSAEAAPAAPPASPPTKPVSPSVGSGAKIDGSADGPKSKEAQLMQTISGILFKR